MNLIDYDDQIIAACLDDEDENYLQLFKARKHIFNNVLALRMIGIIISCSEEDLSKARFFRPIIEQWDQQIQVFCHEHYLKMHQLYGEWKTQQAAKELDQSTSQIPACRKNYTRL